MANKLSRDRIAELPVKARVAFAAACARRALEGLVTGLEQAEELRTLDDLQTAVSVVEHFVTSDELPDDPFRANGRVTEILVRLRHDEELAGHVCSVISESLLAQSAAMARRDDGVTQAASQAAHIASSILGEACIVEVLDRLLMLARTRGWNDGSSIDSGSL